MALARREVLAIGAVALASAAAGLVLGPRLRQLSPDRALLQTVFTDLRGHPRRLEEWRGQAVVCNFWATWCAPCREEIPLLVAAREKFAAKGMEIVGIAIDNPMKVTEFAATFKISYPILQAEAQGLELMRRLGNDAGGLPYTVVADRQGKLAYRKLGALKQPELEATLSRLVQG